MVLKICSFKCFQPQVYQPTQTVHALYKNTQDFFNCFLVHFRRQEIINRGLLLFSRSVVSDSVQPHRLKHARPPCPSPTSGVYPNSCPLSWWCHPTISSSAVSLSSRLSTEVTLFVHGLEQNWEFLSFFFSSLSPPISLSFLLPPPEKQHRMWDHKYIDVFQITMGEVEGSGNLLKSISQASEMTSLLIWGGSPSICCFFC